MSELIKYVGSKNKRIKSSNRENSGQTLKHQIGHLQHLAETTGVAQLREQIKRNVRVLQTPSRN